MGFCAKGLKNEFETAVVNESSVFEPLKFYCICFDMTMSKKASFRQTTLNDVFEHVNKADCLTVR